VRYSGLSRVWQGGFALILPVACLVYAASPLLGGPVVGRQPAMSPVNAPTATAVNVPTVSTGGGASAGARSFGRAASPTADSRTVSVVRGGTVVETPRRVSPLAAAQPVRQPPSLPNPRSAWPRSPTVVSGPINAAAPVVSQMPVANRSDDRVPGAITRGMGTTNQPAVRYGGVAVNRVGVTVNPSQGWNAGPVVRPAPDNPPIDTNSIWYRRYRDRYNVYCDQSNWGPYGPVFYDPGYYIDRVDYLQLNYQAPPILIMGGEAWPDQGLAAPPEPQAEAPPPAAQREAGRAGEIEPPPKRPAGGLTPEKLHDLMVEGVRLFHAGKYNQAASLFLRVTLADRMNIDATLAYAVARFATGDYQIAGLAVRRAVLRMPEVVNADFDVRDRYGNRADFENHLARLEWFLTEQDDIEDAWLVLGFIRHFSGQRELAAQTFERLLSMPGAHVPVVEIFLEAQPLDAQEQPVETQAAPGSQASPMVPAGNEPPLPSLGAAGSLISVEPVE